MSRFRPTLTVEQYRERARALQVEVSEIAWSLVVSPAPAADARRWRALTATETADVFDRLISAMTRFNSADQARVDPGAPR